MDFITFLKNNEFIIKILMAIAEVAIGFVLAPVVRGWINKMRLKGVDKAVLTFTGSSASILIRFLAVVIALGQLGVDMSVVVGACSAIGLGVSLALKDSMANVAGGLQILITKPFTVGDYIAFTDYEGTVQEVELMFTVLQTVNRQEVVIPNSSLVSNTIVNYSQYPTRRIVISVPVQTDASYAKVREDLLELMEMDGRVMRDPAPKTVVAGFTDSGNGMKINMVCYCSNAVYWDVLYSLNEKVQETLVSCQMSQPVDKIQVEQA